MQLQRLSALVKNLTIFYWIATIFSTKKSRNDTIYIQATWNPFYQPIPHKE